MQRMEFSAHLLYISGGALERVTGATGDIEGGSDGGRSKHVGAD